MRPIVINVAWSDCMLITSLSCAKTYEPIEMSYGMWTVDSKNHVLGHGALCRASIEDSIIRRRPGFPHEWTLLRVILRNALTCPQSILSTLFPRDSNDRPLVTSLLVNIWHCFVVLGCICMYYGHTDRRERIYLRGCAHLFTLDWI